MKSLHDYRGEYAAARRRYGRAFNRWRRATPFTREKHELWIVTKRRDVEMFAARDRYHEQLNKARKGGG